MKIQIDNNFHIEVDTFNYTLIETYTGKDKNGKPKTQTKTHGYFNSVEKALERLAREKTIEGHDVMTINEYLRTLKRTTDALIQAVNGVE